MFGLSGLIGLKTCLVLGRLPGLGSLGCRGKCRELGTDEVLYSHLVSRDELYCGRSSAPKCECIVREDAWSALAATVPNGMRPSPLLRYRFAHVSVTMDSNRTSEALISFRPLHT